MSARLAPYRASPSIRQKIETAIEKLIDVLDAIDGDPDFEPDDDHAIDDVPCDDLYGEALARSRVSA